MNAAHETTPRTALVVGGAGGIGRAVCDALAAQGRSVAVADLDPRASEQVAAGLALADGARAIDVALDLTDAASVDAAHERATAELGRVDILVNAAGWDDFVAFVDTDEDFWERIIDINYKGVLRTCQAVVRPMMEAGWGRIVNIASDAGRVGSSNESVYAGAKGAVIAFTKSLARETARYGITANVVCPGPTETPLIRGMAARMADGDAFVDALTRAIPLRRLAEPAEIATAVAYFCDEANGYVTGQTLSVSGGLTMA